MNFSTRFLRLGFLQLASIKDSTKQEHKNLVKTIEELSDDSTVLTRSTFYCAVESMEPL